MADYLQPSFPVFYAICVCVDIITNMPSVCACSPFLCHLNVTGGPFKFYLKNSTWLCIFSVQILLEKMLKKWYLLAESWFWLCIIFCSNSTWKSVEKLDFAAFGRIGFGVAFSAKIISSGRRWTAQTDGIPRHTCSWHCFSWKFQSNCKKILISSFVFFFSNSTWKSAEKWQLLVESWFWLCFFLFKFYLKKCWKMRFCSLW